MNSPFLGHDKIMDLLAKNGANFKVTAKNGKSLLHLAIENGQYETRTISHISNVRTQHILRSIFLEFRK